MSFGKFDMNNKLKNSIGYMEEHDFFIVEHIKYIKCSENDLVLWPIWFEK